MTPGNEEAVREEVSDRIGTELPDVIWQTMYGRATNKLRHIIARYGDADGARTDVDYIAQIVVETIQAEALARETRAQFDRQKIMEAGAKADPQGHTAIILRNIQQSQAIFA